MQKQVFAQLLDKINRLDSFKEENRKLLDFGITRIRMIVNAHILYFPALPQITKENLVLCAEKEFYEGILFLYRKHLLSTNLKSVLMLVKALEMLGVAHSIDNDSDEARNKLLEANMMLSSAFSAVKSGE